MKTICAWCGKLLREEPGEGTSHGICPQCYRAFVEELEKEPPESQTEEEYLPDNPGAILWGMWMGSMRFSLAVGCIGFVLLLAGSMLHLLTGGWFPDPIQWIVELPVK